MKKNRIWIRWIRLSLRKLFVSFCFDNLSDTDFTIDRLCRGDGDETISSFMAS